MKLIRRAVLLIGVGVTMIQAGRRDSVPGPE